MLIEICVAIRPQDPVRALLRPLVHPTTVLHRSSPVDSSFPSSVPPSSSAVSSSHKDVRPFPQVRTPVTHLWGRAAARRGYTFSFLDFTIRTFLIPVGRLTTCILHSACFATYGLWLSLRIPHEHSYLMHNVVATLTFAVLPPGSSGLQNSTRHGASDAQDAYFTAFVAATLSHPSSSPSIVLSSATAYHTGPLMTHSKFACRCA